MYFEVANISASLVSIIGWGILVGLVFSTVGAAGGILASVGLISVFGIKDPNLVKPMAQALTLVTPLIAVPLYMRQCRVVFILAALLGVGGVLGALIGSTLSNLWLADMRLFKPVFAVLVFFIAGQIAWQLLRASAAGDEMSQTLRAAQNFMRHINRGGEACDIGVSHQRVGMNKVLIEFGGETFSFHPWVPLLTGLGIAVLSSALGVGGGFLLVPFMSIVMRLPMYVIAGTSALAIAIHSITSIANYVRLGVELDVALLAFLLSGVVIGSMIGPLVSRRIPEKGLRAFLSAVLFLIGLRYISII
ncbi:MAG: sulfite exporter TauE/SafE family protein [Gammaproteobacteria bacterium]|nr:sulfite exporter TauE/SafE family protein [Gammaproteobacteria bacterium]